MTRRIGSRTGLLVGLMAAAAAGFVAAVVVDRAPSTPSATVVGPAVAGGTSDAAQSRDGAVAAAARLATLLARLFPLDRRQAEQLVGQAASAAYRDTLVTAVDEQLLPLQRQAAGLPGATVYRQSVLATRLEAYSPGRARVSVWLLVTLANTGNAGGQSNPVASFTTVTLDLVWERAAWRLDHTSQQAGPTPLLDGQPQPAREFIAALVGFTDWRPA